MIKFPDNIMVFPPSIPFVHNDITYHHREGFGQIVIEDWYRYAKVPPEPGMLVETDGMQWKVRWAIFSVVNLDLVDLVRDD